MKIPKTTKEKPYIEFIITDKGKIKLRSTSSWWGGINSSFSTTEGEGNTCLPKDLDKYIERFKVRKIEQLEKEISNLQKQLEKLNSIYNISNG